MEINVLGDSQEKHLKSIGGDLPHVGFQCLSLRKKKIPVYKN